MAGGDSKVKLQAEQDTKKKDKRSKKEFGQSVESLTSSVKSLPSDQQLTTVLGKYGHLLEENKRLQTSSKTAVRQAQVSQKEKEQLETEHSKSILSKSRLESLCRELQRQNKTIKDENMSRLREEEEKRKDVSNHFNTTLSEISALMLENTDKNSKLREENKDTATRLRDLIKQYEAREDQIDKILKQRELQVQLVDAKFAKSQMDFNTDKEKLLIDKKGHLEELSEYQEKVAKMSMNELTLRQQLAGYTEKYAEFQGTLEKSDKIFNTFKKEMDELTKKIKKLEKETKLWRERWEGANKALIDMAFERTAMDTKLTAQTKQNTQLRNLCRALQQELTQLRKTANGSSATSECEVIANVADSLEALCDSPSDGAVAVPPQCPATTNGASLDSLGQLCNKDNDSVDTIPPILTNNYIKTSQNVTQNDSSSCGDFVCNPIDDNEVINNNNSPPSNNSDNSEEKCSSDTDNLLDDITSRLGSTSIATEGDMKGTDNKKELQETSECLEVSDNNSNSCLVSTESQSLLRCDTENCSSKPDTDDMTEITIVRSSMDEVD